MVVVLPRPGRMAVSLPTSLPTSLTTGGLLSRDMRLKVMAPLHLKDMGTHLNRNMSSRLRGPEDSLEIVNLNQSTSRLHLRRVATARVP